MTTLSTAASTTDSNSDRAGASRGPRPQRTTRAEVARGWLVELARNPEEPLAQTFSPRLLAVADALASAVTERDRIDAALDPHQVTARLFVDEVNRALDVLEGDLKKLFPCEPERVASFLSATRLRRSTGSEETTESIATPAV